MTDKKKANQLTEAEAIALLRTKFDAQGYALFPQVPDATGFGRCRTADAIMMSLWPSRGLHLFGIEYKRTKADWKRELNNPAKADSIGRYCDFWYILAPKGIVDIAELPVSWGLWEIDDRYQLLRTKIAPANEHKKPIDLEFFAALMRAAQNAFSGTQHKDAALIEEYRRGVEVGKQDGRYNNKQRERDLETLQENIDDFEKASGIKISSWSGEQLGNEVRQGLQLLSKPDHYIRTAERICDDASRLRDAATALVNTMQNASDD